MEVGFPTDPKLSLFSLLSKAVHPDNFLFFCVQRGESIRKVLAKSPSEKAEEVVGAGGVSYPVVKSQPIEHNNPWDSSAEDILNVLIYLANYGHGKHFFLHLISCAE